MKQPIKVAMLIQGYYPEVGGAERQLASLAPRLIDRGLSVTVYTRRKGELPALDDVAGVPVHRLAIPGGKATRSLSFSFGALQRLRQSRPDVIHAHDLFSPSTTALLAKKLFGIPVVVKIVRGGYLGDLQWLGRRRFGRKRVEWICNNVDHFIVISKEIDAELAELGVLQQRRTLIPNGVDCRRFSSVGVHDKARLRAELGLPDGLIVIYAGRLATEKRVQDIVLSWPAVRDRHPSATLLIVGTGERESALRQAAGDGVIFTGAVADVAPYLQVADLFVLPSVAEGLSNALLEAMASGLACIATDVGGARELVTHGQSGLLIPPQVPAVLLEHVLSLLDNAPLRVALGKHARAHVNENFSLDNVARKLDKLYHQVVGRD